jgi:ABC-type antimicrobial peptide transport system permease subunit
MTLHVRVDGSVPDIAARIRREVQGTDARMPLPAIETLALQVDTALSRERLVATLSTAFAALALALACVGLYGLLSFVIVGRSGEIGIRMALGAVRGSVLRLVMRDALGLVAAGLAIGIPAAIIAGRLSASRVDGLLFRVTATDPVTMAGAVTVLVALATLAAYLPAARAARIDPLVALRNE